MSQDSNGETMKESAAATKIQANFRGYRVRKHLKETKEEESEPTGTAQQDPALEGDIEGNESISGRQDPTREVLEERSATKIQAGVRGFLVRKRQQAARTAATRIQAGFRGFKTRKLLKQNG